MCSIMGLHSGNMIIGMPDYGILDSDLGFVLVNAVLTQMILSL